MATDAGGRHPVARKRVLYELPAAADVRIRPGIPFPAAASREETLTLYHPPGWAGQPAPAVIFVSGMSDIGARTVLGCRISEMESYVSWARLVAASGLVGITYTTGQDAADDTRAVLAFLHAGGVPIGVDPDRLGLWACSGNVPNALGQLMARPPGVRCAALCYGYMLDLDGETGVAEAERVWRFANPAAGRSVADLPTDVSLFVARAGRDDLTGLNDSIDRFLVHALRGNLPLTFVNHPTGPHAFDLDDTSGATRRIVRQLLTFLRDHLLAEA